MVSRGSTSICIKRQCTKDDFDEHERDLVTYDDDDEHEHIEGLVKNLNAITSSKLMAVQMVVVGFVVLGSFPDDGNSSSWFNLVSRGCFPSFFIAPVLRLMLSCLPGW